MKLEPRTFATYWSVHAWVGLLSGLIAYPMFFFGVFALFYQPIDTWEDADRQYVAKTAPAEIERAIELAYPARRAVPAKFRVNLPVGTHGTIEVCDETRDGTPACVQVSPTGQQVTAVYPHASIAGLLFELHFLAIPQVPHLQTVGGVACLMFVLSIVTGVLIHLKDLVRQFFRVRWHGSQRTLWSDLHKVLSVTGLPFQLFFAFTGALLSVPLIALLTSTAYPNDEAEADRVVWGAPRAAHDSPLSPNPSLSEILKIAQLQLPGLNPQSLRFSKPSGEPATVVVKGPIRDVFNGRGEVSLSLHDGKVLEVYDPSVATATQTLRRALFGVHFVNFGGLFWKLLFALFSIATCLTILSGNLIWLARRTGAGRGNWILERLTIATGAGLALATGALFAGSCLLRWLSEPPGAGWFLLWAWLTSLLWAFLSPTARGAWRWQLLVGAILFVATPLLAAVTSPAGLFGHGPGLPEVLGVDVGLLWFGAALGVLAWRVGRAPSATESSAER